MIGWHYTALSNWQSIQERGLQPYPIDKYEVTKFFDATPMAIWIWKYEPTPENELGNIIWQLYTKGQLKVIKLQVEYDLADRLKLPWGRAAIITHTGSVGAWDFHTDTPEGMLITKPILPDKIKLLRTFNFMNIVNNEEAGSKQAKEK